MSSQPATLSDNSDGAGFEPRSLVELLRWRAARQPDRLAYTFLLDGETEEASLTYGELDEKARAIAARLQADGAEGQRALLLYPPGLDYIAAFFGCLYAGAVAVPTYPPRQNRSIGRLQSIITDAQARFVLTTSQVLARLESATEQVGALKRLRFVASDVLAGEGAALWREPRVDGETLAFLQYTSGSTAAPKGVMVTHGNLLHNEQLIRAGCRHTADSTFVGWLPLYHDMGLIGNVLQPLYVGSHCVLMSPVAFLQKPLRWLQAISRYRAATSGGPNFAYNLCVRKVSPEERAALDLSSWTTAFNGAEPVRRETMEEFTAAFADCGFRAEVFYPCYGLAEATLIVSGGAPGERFVSCDVRANELERDRVVVEETPAEGTRALVGSGRALLDQRVVIADPETCARRGDDEVGEIWVQGPSVARGYWKRPEETEKTFGARLKETGEGPFLRTGDLGFLRGGELYVTGRLKDLIIIRGRNHYPQDIELTAERSHAALRPGCGAAFSVEENGDERLVVVQEVNHRRAFDAEEVVEHIRQAIAEEHEAQVYAVVLIKSGSIPKTSSGKIQRHACRVGYLEQSLDTVARLQTATTTPATAEEVCEAPGAARPSDVEGVEAWLASLLASKLGVAASAVDTNSPLSRYGIDSLLAVELAHAVETGLSVSLPMVRFLQETSVARLASEIFARLKEAEAATGAGDSADAGASALSRGQKGLWFLHKVAPDSPAYNISSAVRVAAGLDEAALGRAFQTLVERHESLRTTFEEVDGEPVCRVGPTAEVSFDAADAADWTEEILSARLSEEAHRPFDLSTGPLLRIHLFRRGAEGHVLLLSLHHIIADFWSLGVLLRELSALYGAEKGDAPAPLAAPATTFGECVRRQEELMSGPEGERLWSYWREQLAGEMPSLNLPLKGQRPASQTFRGASHPFRVGAGLTRALKELSRERGATLYMVLLAAFETLLYRYTGQEDITVGSPTTGRGWQEWRDLVGYFVNPVVLRANPTADATFEEFLGGVRRNVLGAFEHQDFPFATLVERLQPTRDNSRPPLFQVMFVLQKAHRREEEGLALFALGEGGARLDLGALSLESVALEQRVSQFDLTLNMAEAEDGLLGSLQYNTDLFDGDTVRRMASNFETLLAAAAQNPALRLSELPLLAAEERDQLLFGFNATARDYPSGSCLHQLFERQAAETPDSTALVFQEERLSYRELNERANRLARHLLSLGVRAESRVGVLLTRRTELLVSLLAVMKAGGCYVPLDPSYPRDRLAFMLEDASAAALITEESLLDLLPAHGAAVVNLDAWRPEPGPSENPVCKTTERNLAYLIYTSGSTGKPKAVSIEHRSAVTFSHWARESFSAEELSGVLASTSVCFDLSVFELFVPLSCGGKVILCENALALPTLPAASEVRLVNTVPSAMAELVRQGGVPAGVRTVNLAGEALKASLVEAVYAAGDVERVANLYGPSEDTTYSTWCVVGRDEEVTIGRPLANTRVYVVDACMRPVPVGVPGELLIGGDGLARGYLNRPALTAERFVPHPFSDEPGARLYRTGDLARFLPDGRLDFLGRLDHQVKVRGFRIELGEIESALLRHESVREAVVVAREAAAGDLRLVAYLSGGGSHVPPIPELRTYLKELLPEYMVPSIWVALERLPLTPNGKVDRKSLPAPEASRPGPDESYVSPRTPVEEVLADIWSEVLGAERVGVEDNFFDLGGHSLLVTQVASRVRSTLNVELPLRAVFESPTVAELASRVEAATADDVASTPPLLKAERGGPLPLSFAQQRLWFLDQLEPGSAAYNVPAAVRLTGRLDAAALERSLNEIVSRHESLRTTFTEIGGRPAQVVHEAAEISLPVVDLTHLAEDEREAEAACLARAEARCPFDLSTGPLLRVSLVQLGAEQRQLLVTMHHIVSDAWSVGVLLREMAALYRAHANCDAPCFEELPVQYADFALWQRGWLHGEVVERQLEYWEAQLKDAPAVLELPADRPRPAVQTFNGSFETFLIAKQTADSLKALARREGVTLFMATLAAFKALLHRYTRQSDILVGTPIANRNRAETEPLIGFFVNTLVMRTRLDDAESFRELLPQVRETALAAYNHQDLPFEQLVEALRPERNLSHSPLFQVMFALQNAPAETPALDGLEVEVREVETGTSKFDLNLSLTDGEDGLTAKFEYNTDLFDGDTVRRMASNFETLLAAAAQNPDCRMADLPLLSESEQRRLREWNATARYYPSGSCLHQLFERQAAETPDSTALVFQEERLSYRELNERANRLARHLLSLGVRAESRVGVLLTRRTELLVSLLAVMKAGGCYVPLDPSYPRDRLAFMLEDAGVKVLLTSGSLSETVPAGSAHLLCLEQSRAEISRQPATTPPCEATPRNLAYLIYTSGSTGKPKAVSIEHRSAVTFSHWARESFSAEELSGVLASTSVCFDLSVFELFVPLSCGGKVILCENALALPELPAASEVRLVNTVPSAMAELVRQGGVPAGVKVVNLAGEALKRSLVEAVYESAGVERVLNLYGPSEDTTYSTFTQVARCESGEPTIGRPLANTRVHVVDANLRPVPVGVAGELLIGGDGLARGYLNRPALTAERFVPDPFGGAGERLYRTGDLARFLSDGQVEFLGRIDHQVKVRGFRIELGEIESALLRHYSVREAVVVAREAAASDLRLVAYLSGDNVPPVTELRSHLKETLPEHMIPSMFVVLDALPLTPNGKVDRKALPAPEASRPDTGETYVAPRNPVEEVLAGIWAEVLGVERVGVEDNFFDLGGHSLLVTQIASRVRSAFNVELPLRSLFENPTVAEAALALAKAREGEAAPEAPAIRRIARARFALDASTREALTV